MNERNVTFQGMSPKIPGIVAKNSGNVVQDVATNIPGNVLNIPENIFKQCNECFFASASPLYTDFKGNKHTKKQTCSELSATGFQISYSTNLSVGSTIL